MWNLRSRKEAGCVPGKLVWRIRDPLPSFSFLRFASLSYNLNSPANIFLRFSFCPNFHLIPLPIIYLSYFVSIFYCAVYILTFLQIPNKSKFSLTDWCTHITLSQNTHKKENGWFRWFRNGPNMENVTKIRSADALYPLILTNWGETRLYTLNSHT